MAGFWILVMSLQQTSLIAMVPVKASRGGRGDRMTRGGHGDRMTRAGRGDGSGRGGGTV